MNKKTIDTSRSCYECENYMLCYFRYNLNSFIIAQGNGMLDFDCNNPNVVTWQFLYIAVANACLEFKQRQDKD